MKHCYPKVNYDFKFQNSNFKILKLEDLFLSENSAVFEKNHKVNFYTIMVITNDIGRHSIDYNDFYYSKGTVLAIRKDQIHRFYINNNVKGYLLLFKEEFLNSYLNERQVSMTIQMFNEWIISPKTQFNKDEFLQILQLSTQIEKEFTNLSDDYSLKIIRSQLHVLITLIHRTKSKGYNKIQLGNYLKEFIKFQGLLEKNYIKSKKVQYYANKLGFSSKKLNTIVQFIANKSAKVFIDDVVIIKAKNYLLHSNLSIKEVSFKLGFKDPANLCKYFKKHTKFTPEAYRKRYKV
ncbi:AraC family transcriptional regulator [Polaribacter sp. R77954]|uniref:AraC family transcriptional regulator n=1 Tax=Polaribacter sp. R77954 TaxID=3093870 RepID=UPI0037CC6D2D